MIESERYKLQAPEVEEVVLGACLLESSAFDIAARWLNIECFYTEANGIIWQAMADIKASNSPIDLIIVYETLRRKGQVDTVGGMGYVSGLVNRVCSTANLEHHCAILVEYKMKRDLVAVGCEMAVTNEIDDVFDLYRKHELTLKEIQANAKSDFAYNTREIRAEILSLFKQKAGQPLSTGFRDLPLLTAGNVYVIAARPGMGKTSLAMDIAVKQAEAGVPVAFFSLEMERKQLFLRSIAGKMGINSNKLLYPHLMNSFEQLDFERYMSEMKDLPLFIYDRGGISVAKLVNEAERLVKQEGVKAVYIDYLQLLSADLRKGETRDQEIGRITKALKTMAKDLQVPVVQLAQLSRAIDGKTDKHKRPALYALRDSGNIEQEADMVAFIYRPEYYGITEDEAGNSTAGVAEFIIAKNRFGALETKCLTFKAEFSSFRDYDGEPMNYAVQDVKRQYGQRGAKKNFYEKDAPF